MTGFYLSCIVDIDFPEPELILYLSRRFYQLSFCLVKHVVMKCAGSGHIAKVWKRRGEILLTPARFRLHSTLPVGLLCGVTCLISACQSQVATPQVFPVDVNRIQIRDFDQSIQAEGTLINPGYIQLKPQASGLITHVLVQEGDPVQRGQVLVVLDNAEQRADLRTAQAELKEALIQAKRWSKLALLCTAARNDRAGGSLQAVLRSFGPLDLDTMRCLE